MRFDAAAAQPPPTFAADGGPDQLGAVVDAVREDARPVHVLQTSRTQGMRRFLSLRGSAFGKRDVCSNNCTTSTAPRGLCHSTPAAVEHTTNVVGQEQTFGQYDGRYGPRTLLLMNRMYSYCDVSTCNGHVGSQGACSSAQLLPASLMVRAQVQPNGG